MSLPSNFSAPWTLPKLIAWAEYGLEFAKTKGSYFPDEDRRADSQARFEALLIALRTARDHQLSGSTAANENGATK